MCAVRVRSAVPVQPPLILIVEDDADPRALYRDVVASRNDTVIEAGDGREALLNAFVRPPALVIMKFALPHGNGGSLTDILWQDPTTRPVPVVMVMAETSPACLQRARTAGADVVLQKPVAIDRIVSESERLLSTGRDERPDVVITDHHGAAAAQAAPPRRLSTTFARGTTTAPVRTPLPLVCPSCDRARTSERRHIGGMNARAAKHWDDYSCTSCGNFPYRQRTRLLSPRAESVHGFGRLAPALWAHTQGIRADIHTPSRGGAA